MIRADNLRDAVYVSYSVKKRKNASNEQNVGSCYIYKAIKQQMFIPPFFLFLIFWRLDSKEPGKGPTSIHRMKNPTGLFIFAGRRSEASVTFLMRLKFAERKENFLR